MRNAIAESVQTAGNRDAVQVREVILWDYAQQKGSPKTALMLHGEIETYVFAIFFISAWCALNSCFDR